VKTTVVTTTPVPDSNGIDAGSSPRLRDTEVLEDVPAGGGVVGGGVVGGGVVGGGVVGGGVVGGGVVGGGVAFLVDFTGGLVAFFVMLGVTTTPNVGPKPACDACWTDFARALFDGAGVAAAGAAEADGSAGGPAAAISVRGDGW